MDELGNLIGEGIGEVFPNLRNIEPDDQMVSWAVSFSANNMHIDGLGPWGLQITGEAILALPPLYFYGGTSSTRCATFGKTSEVLCRCHRMSKPMATIQVIRTGFKFSFCQPSAVGLDVYVTSD